ncbi:MAG: carboxypeptidase regulatory-like domain-containing protein [Deltaproteobacteria bacterium]|nr:MAG: carboxypeptidase regulatory-like domain-containing protein [Deltaproteobacteria bacterium]
MHMLLAALGAVVIAAAVVIVAVQRSRTPSAVSDARRAGSAAGAGGAAIRAPGAPELGSSAPIGVRLTGFVVDGAGLPVAGAEVSAEPERGIVDRALAPPPRAGAASAAPDSAGAGGAGGQGADAADAGTHAVAVAPPTGGDGRFVVDGLSPGRVRVRVAGAGILPAELRYVPVPSDEVRIVVARQIAIEGTVTDGGKPVANAPVGLRGDAIGGTIETRTSATGAFRFGSLPEGRFQLFAWQGALAARTVRLSPLGAGPFGAVELRLEAAAIVVGRVIDREEGTGLVAAIELRPSGDDQAPRYVRSGDDGVFRVEGVPSGRWIADAFVPGYLSPGGIELEAGHGIPEIALTRGGAIAGRILDGDGHSIAGAQVRSLTTGANPTELSAEVERDKLRRFSGRTAAPVPTAAPGALDADPQFIARGELGVMVGAIPPIPPPGAHVAQMAIAVDPSLAGEPAPLPVDPARASIWTTAADGAYRIRGFSAGKVVVLASAPGFAEVRSRPVAIQPGQVIAGIDLVLTPGTVIVGKVTDQHGAPVIGAQVSVTPAAHDSAAPGASPGSTLDAFTDDAGEYKLGPVTGGVELRATAYGHGEARRTLELAAVRGATPAQHREDLVLVVADAVFAGILEDAAGAPVGGAHLDVVGGVGDGRHAIVAPDGTFSIDLLPAGPLRLHIEHPAYPPEDVDVVAGEAHQARARLRLPLGGGVEGAVLDAASGAPIPGITLAASGPGNALAEAATDKLGRWKLAPLRPGRWKIAVKQPGYLAQARELDVSAARTPGATSLRDIRIELARGALIGGTVRDARGQRVAAAHVIAAAAAGGATCEGDSDGRGEFRLHDCPTGDVAVAASKADGRAAARLTVRAGDEVLGVSLELR